MAARCCSRPSLGGASRNRSRRSAAAAATLPWLLMALAATIMGRQASAQMLWPVAGHLSPPAGNITVQVDVLIDSVESIDANANLWNGFVWFHLQWQDDRAANAIAQATSQWAANAVGSSFNNVTGCQLPCDYTGHPAAGCCDGVYMPHLEIPNVVGLNQEAVYKWRVWLEPDPNNGSALNIVHRTTLVSATFRSPYDFRAWPFEHQHLLIEMQAPPSQADRVTLVLNNAKQLTDTPHTKGAIMPGWHVVTITKRVYDMSNCYNATNMTTSLWNISADGTQVVFKPLYPDGWLQLSMPQNPELQYTYIDNNQCQQPLVLGADTMEGLAGYAPQVIVVDIMIKRDLSFYVLAHVVPQILLAYLVFTIYAMDRTELEARMGVVVTLVLAISALQFTWSFPPAAYLNAVQQVMLATYILYFVVAIESMITSHISRMHARRRQYAGYVKIAHAPSMPHQPPALGLATNASTSSLGQSMQWRSGAPQPAAGGAANGYNNNRGDALAAAAAAAIAEVDGQAEAGEATATAAGGGGAGKKAMLVAMGPMAAATAAAAAARDSAAPSATAGGRKGVTAQQLQLANASSSAALLAGAGGIGTAVDGQSGHSATGMGTAVAPGGAVVLTGPQSQMTNAHSSVGGGRLQSGSSVAVDMDVALDVLPSPSRASGLPRSVPAGTGAGTSPLQAPSVLPRSVSGAKRHQVAEGEEAATALLLTSPYGTRSGAGPVAEGLDCFEPQADNPAMVPLKVNTATLGNKSGLSGSGLGEPSPAGGNTPSGPPGQHRWAGFMGMGIRRNVSSLGRSMSMRMSAAATATRNFSSRIDKDEAYAQLFASRLDTIFCWTLLTCFSIVLAVLLWVNTQIGDHKLMLSSTSRPANM